MTTGSGKNERPQDISWRTATVALLVLMLAGLALRLHGIDQALVTFHPTRHYRSANLARACYYDASPGVSTWARQVASANRAMQPAGEPQVMEWLACRSYRLLGHEDVRIPRLLAALSWVLGALPLYLLASRLSSAVVALLAATLYLFIPYGIVATRTFQPDPLMTLCSLCAVLAVARSYEQPHRSRLLAAAALIALAALVKPMSVFLTLAAALGLAFGAGSWRQVITDRRLLQLLVLGLAPAILYYGYAALFGTLAKDQMRMRFVPALLTSEFFWDGWLTQIRRVFGVPLFLLAMVGVVVAPHAGARSLLAALWLGYAAFAVAFTYHMPTHDYYHLPYIAVVALSVAACVERLQIAAAGRVPKSAPVSQVLEHASQGPHRKVDLFGQHFGPSRVQVLATLVASASIAVWGTVQAWPRLTVLHAEETVSRFERIGELTKHDTRVLFLDLEYGYSLMYHGQLSGDAWPNVDDLAAESLGGLRPISASDRFERDFARFGPRYFVVTDLQSLAAEPDLRQLLADRTVPVEKTGTYHVYRFVDQRGQ